MGKIRLNNGQEMEIIADGIRATGDYLTLGLVPGDNDKVFKIYSGYTKMQKIEKQMETVVDYTQDEEGNPVPVNGVAIIVELQRPDETEARIASLEETVDKLVLDSLGIA